MQVVQSGPLQTAGNNFIIILHPARISGRGIFSFPATKSPSPPGKGSVCRKSPAFAGLFRQTEGRSMSAPTSTGRKQPQNLRACCIFCSTPFGLIPVYAFADAGKPGKQPDSRCGPRCNPGLSAGREQNSRCHEHRRQPMHRRYSGQCERERQ